MKPEKPSQDEEFIARVQEYARIEQNCAREAFRDIQKQVFGFVSVSSAVILSLCVTFLDRFSGRADSLLILTLCFSLCSMVSGTLSLAILARWYRELMEKWVVTVWAETIEDIRQQKETREEWKRKSFDGSFLGWIAIISYCIQFIAIFTFGITLLYFG